jgi:hypothetical protein
VGFFSAYHGPERSNLGRYPSSQASLLSEYAHTEGTLGSLAGFFSRRIALNMQTNQPAIANRSGVAGCENQAMNAAHQKNPRRPKALQEQASPRAISREARLMIEDGTPLIHPALGEKRPRVTTEMVNGIISNNRRERRA